jgi:hypothetical protein
LPFASRIHVWSPDSGWPHTTLLLLLLLLLHAQVWQMTDLIASKAGQQAGEQHLT